MLRLLHGHFMVTTWSAECTPALCMCTFLLLYTYVSNLIVEVGILCYFCVSCSSLYVYIYMLYLGVDFVRFCTFYMACRTSNVILLSPWKPPISFTPYVDDPDIDLSYKLCQSQVTWFTSLTTLLYIYLLWSRNEFSYCSHNFPSSHVVSYVDPMLRGVIRT